MTVAIQASLIAETGPLKVAPGDPFCVFEMTGAPRGKGAMRHRIVQPRGKPAFVHGYFDADTVAYIEALRRCAMAAMIGRAPTFRPVALLMHAFMPIPASWSQRSYHQALLGALLPTVKPDWSNIAKCEDALTGIVWTDDAIVVDGRVIKRYSAAPGLRVEVREFLPPH